MTEPMNAAQKARAAAMQKLGELLMQGEETKKIVDVRGVQQLLGPGVYDNIPAAEYFALPYCSNSRLTLLQRSPAHLRADIDNPGEATPAMLLGTAIHMAVLEWEAFAKHYTMADQCAATLASGKRKGERCTNSGKERHDGVWFCGQHAPDAQSDAVQVLTLADYAACEGVRQSIYAHPKLGRLIRSEGRAELTVIWDDPDTGVRCKARIDKLVVEHGGVVLDLKSTTDARAEEFERTVYQRGYFRQLGMYQDAASAHGIEVKHLVMVAAEKVAPYAVAGFRLTDIAADAGREELRRLMERYAECQARNEWPAYPTDISEISLPAWAWNRMEGVAA